MAAMAENDIFKIQLKRFVEEKDLSVEDFEKLYHYLKTDLGALKMDDLVELTIEDLEDERAGMKRLQRKTFITALKDRYNSIRSIVPKPKTIDTDQLSVSSASTTFHMESELFSSEYGDTGFATPVPAAPTMQHHGITIRYVHCKNIFLFPVKEKCILNLNPATNSLGDLYRMMASQLGITEDLKLELYFREGYPLDLNDHTIKASLYKWGISNDCLLYTFARPLNQSGVTPATDVGGHTSSVDARNGPHTLRIHSQLHGEFTISLDLEEDDTADVKQKVHSCVNIHPSLFDLVSKDGLDLEDGSPGLDLEDGSELLMIPKQYYLLYDGSFDRDFGACTYQSIVEQTPAGNAKFYSCLYYLMKEQNQEMKAKIICHIDREYGCPPMTYALLCLFQQKTLKQLGCWVALVEGLFQLFKTILCIYCEVPENRIFEFSDYLWGLIITQAKKRSSSSCERYSHESLSLACPISATKMLEPVNLQGSQTTYERDNILKKIEDNEAVEGCDVSTLSEEDLIPNELVKRLLMCHMFSEASDVTVWVDPSHFYTKRSIDRVFLPTDVTVESFATCNGHLKIIDPKSLLNLPGTACHLTFYKGRTAVSVGSTKVSLDRKEFIVYNPLYDPKTEEAEVHLSKEALADALVGERVKLKDFLNAKVQAGVDPHNSPYVSLTSSLGSFEHGNEEITQEPLEAIVVTLDVSTSMKEHIYPEKGTDYSRIRAAKDLFDAFVNRTLAYKFHHVIGLITFESRVEVRLQLTEVLPSLINALSRVEPHGNTALYDAIAKACTLLEVVAEKFPACKKRILCLTDGEDNRSKVKLEDVLRTLRVKDIVVDTVLITGSSSNANQKALSFASGGYCFYPKTMVEATKVFEIEQLVSIRERPSRQQSLTGTLSDFRLLAFTPSDPYGKKEFQTKLTEIVDRTTFTTTQRIVQQFLLLGPGSSTTSVAGSSNRIRRILKELRQYQRNPHSSVDVFPSEDVTLWRMVLSAPENTPYEGGVFLLYVKFPDEYPAQPPIIRFQTPIYHCNINSSGRICHSSLDNHYVPAMTIREIISYIYGLLMDPEPADPLDSVLALELREDRAQYEAKARQLTGKFAGLDRCEVKRQIVTTESEAHSEMVCPLTKKMFVDPVITSCGHSYERGALLKYVREHGSIDPIAQKPIDIAQLTPNVALKKLMETLRQAQKAFN